MTKPRDTDLPPVQLVELGDGRELAYIEVGDPSGYPLISNHGGLSSRLDIVPADASARAHGLHVIAPDRPGIGRSDPQDNRTMAGWASDIGELVDHLGIERFGVMGWSFGGAFAQAVAHGLARRVSALALIASVIPRDWANMREDIDRMDRMFMKLSEGGPGRLADRSIFHLMGATAHLMPKAFGKSSGAPAAQRDLLSAAIAEGLSNTKGVVQDYQLNNIPWGFDPSEIRVPTQIWQGEADELLPSDWGPRLHEAIEGSTFTLVPGATHFVAYDHWDEIFAAVLRATAG